MGDQAQGVRVRGLLAGRAVRLLLVEAHALAEHTRVVHGLGPDAAALGAQTVVAAALLGAHIKGDEQITLQLHGSEPRCSAYVDLTASGQLRARITPSDLTLGGDGRLSGVLVVVKHAPSDEVYRGATSVEAETLQSALAEHLGASAQVDAMLRIGVSVDAEGRVVQAGGLLIERLPEEHDQPSMDRAAFRERFGALQGVPTDQLLTQLAFGALGDDPVQVLESAPLVWQCRCSQGRIEATLKGLGIDVLREMLDEDQGADVHCNFCDVHYVVTEGRLEELLAEASAD